MSNWKDANEAARQRGGGKKHAGLMVDEWEIVPLGKLGQHPTDGIYFEKFWTSKIGPAGVLLMRELDRKVHDSVYPAELAHQLGIMHKEQPDVMRLCDKVARLIRLRLIRSLGPSPDDPQVVRLAIPSHVPDAPPSLQAGWPEALMIEHDEVVSLTVDRRTDRAWV